MAPARRALLAFFVHNIGEPEMRTVFYFALGSFVAGGIAATVLRQRAVPKALAEEH